MRIKFNGEINISLKTILTRYIKIPKYYKNILKNLYAGKYKKYKVKDIVNINATNSLTQLDALGDKVGVYIFLNDNNEPVYIGVAGEIGSRHSLKDRIGIQLNCNPTNSTISKNIETIEELLGNVVNYSVHTGDENKSYRKSIIRKYCPYFIVVITGELENGEAIKSAVALEKFLIALFNSKYNL